MRETAPRISSERPSLKIVLAAVGAQVGEGEDGEGAAVVRARGTSCRAGPEGQRHDRGGDGDADNGADEASPPPACSGTRRGSTGTGTWWVPVPSDSSWATSASASGTRSPGSLARSCMTMLARPGGASGQLRHGGRLLRHLGGEKLLGRAGTERRMTGEHLVSHDAERVEIGSVVEAGIGHDLFGRHVGGRAEGHADAGEHRLSCATR